MLLNPRNAAEARCQLLKLNIDDTGLTEYFICQNLRCFKPEISLNIPAALCSCGSTLSKTHHIISNKSTETGRASFIVTDDLHVISNMPTTVFELFEKLGISDLNAVDEITLNIGYKEMLTLLKCSVQSNSPLTDAFVSKRSNMGCLAKPSDNETAEVEETTENTLTVKLVIQKSNGKILFAHAEESFVDFLFSLLTIPLGGVARILSGNMPYRSVGNLYNSLLTLKVDRHLKSQNLKSMLLNPQVAALHLSKNHIFPFAETEAEYYCYAKTHIRNLALYKVKCGADATCVK
ncbi:hypothetical protein POM88_029696 [Heracleum sosnowskyi]|uniref:DUF674 family protein n=1 Tax=Heracleum sosnowskyi TaxID=360622 RepID=A0AAD8MIQ7_9APIA|nr:hypothetical protein POM88_029696 [Heracleum sosnowskyi]